MTKLWTAVFFATVSLVATRVYAGEGPPIVIESVVLRPFLAVEVPARQTGVIKSIAIDEGDRVEEGQVLVTLDDRESELVLAESRLQCAQAESKAANRVGIAYTQKAIEVAKAELRRSQESIEKFPKSISQSQLDVERLTLEKLSLELQEEEHQLALAEFDLALAKNASQAALLKLELHRLRAPFAGTVTLIRGRVGEWVEVGSPVLRLVATDKLRAEGFLAAERAHSALVGRRVEFIARSSVVSTAVEGVLRFVSPEMDPVTGQVRVWAELPVVDALLRPGQQGQLKILGE